MGMNRLDQGQGSFDKLTFEVYEDDLCSEMEEESSSDKVAEFDKWVEIGKMDGLIYEVQLDWRLSVSPWMINFRLFLELKKEEGGD